MKSEASEIQFVYKYFRERGLREFPFLAIGRQGFRSAVEILADAIAKEGRYVTVGAHLSGARSMGVNVITLRFADTADIPTGIYPICPNGLFIAHESFLDPERLWQGSPGVSKSIGALQDGILMVCTSKPPEAIEYPLNFQGTVATVDAEAIFSERIAIEPAPYGVTALGLFIRATDDIISLEAVKRSILGYERLRKKVRELNIETMQKAYENAKVLPNISIKGKFNKKEYEEMTKSGQAMVATSEGGVSEGGAGGYAWKDKLPVCDQTKCKCIECLAVYYCPEAAISWRDEVYNVDYDFCKGCGTCAQECTENAIRMEDAEKVLAGLSKKRK
jgi:2-oxoacid:acceptor oxidoreductase delta subunit (pyruvate/2-ketoisovalerate family)